MNRIKYSQTSSLDEATGGNGERDPGASSLGLPRIVFRGPWK